MAGAAPDGTGGTPILGDERLREALGDAAGARGAAASVAHAEVAVSLTAP